MFWETSLACKWAREHERFRCSIAGQVRLAQKIMCATSINKEVAAQSIIIVGGGISGLSTAYFLGQHGIRSTIVEKAERLGGLIKTDFIEGCLLEAGPDSYIASKTAVTELAQELGDLQ